MGGIRWFFLEGGWQKLPWKNSWFALATFAAIFSGGLLLTDLTGTKTGPGSSGSLNSSSSSGQQGYSAPSNPPAPSGSPSFSPSSSSGFWSHIPFFAKPGSLTVSSSPTGATVHVSGEPDALTPATFERVSAGSHTVTISAPGYETMTRNVDIKSETQTPIDVGQLVRSTGNLALITIPARALYTLKSTSADNPVTRHGQTPADLVGLPVDKYAITLDSPRTESQSVEVDVVPRQTTTQSVDLVRGDVAGNVGPAVAKVLFGEADASTLNDADKKEYADRLNREIQEYVRVGAFPQASAAIASLKNIGQDTTAQEQHLTEMRDGYEQKITAQIKDLIAQKQLGAARSKLKAVEDNVPSETADRLNTQFKGDLGPYAQQIDDAIKSASSGAPSAGFDQLQTLAQQHPDDVSLALARARLLTEQPPDHPRISAQLNTLKQFNPENLASDDATDLQTMEAKLQNELATYDRLQAAVDQEKKPSIGDSASHIASLEREIARDEAAIRGASSVNNAVNSITTGIFHTRIHVVDVSAKQAEIDRDQARIQEIKNAQQSSQTTTSSAQGELDAFAAKVPW